MEAKQSSIPAEAPRRSQSQQEKPLVLAFHRHCWPELRTDASGTTSIRNIHSPTRLNCSSDIFGACDSELRPRALFLYTSLLVPPSQQVSSSRASNSSRDSCTVTSWGRGQATASTHTSRLHAPEGHSFHTTRTSQTLFSVPHPSLLDHNTTCSHFVVLTVWSQASRHPPHVHSFQASLAHPLSSLAYRLLHLHPALHRCCLIPHIKPTTT